MQSSCIFTQNTIDLAKFMNTSIPTLV